jgi:hypothetical protein
MIYAMKNSETNKICSNGIYDALATITSGGNPVAFSSNNFHLTSELVKAPTSVIRNYKENQRRTDTSYI